MTANPAEMTETPEAGTLDAALDGLRLDGALFLRAEYTEAWGYESLDAPTTAGLLRPGTERVILFHLVASGCCWVALDDGERHWAERGDVIVLPYGDHHTMGGSDDADLVSIATILEPPPWDVMPVIKHGAGGARTDVVCGYLHSDDPLFDPALRALPPLFVVHPPDGPLARWVASSIEFALETARADARTTSPTARKLPELLLTEVLRLHLATAPAVDHGWMAALRDPVLAPAMALVHTQPERKWTVADLASEVAVSRSVLDERFRQVLGRSPIRYLTDWRMHIAVELLASTDASVAAVARRVGYDSEEAFSRAFKRAHDVAPSTWRGERRPVTRR
jgi:AraC-like DNA-binding protein